MLVQKRKRDAHYKTVKQGKLIPRHVSSDPKQTKNGDHSSLKASMVHSQSGIVHWCVGTFLVTDLNCFRFIIPVFVSRHVHTYLAFSLSVLLLILIAFTFWISSLP